jgi:predicted RNA-binding Zn-ribbon protein involved in translation (DUF1610 family)
MTANGAYCGNYDAMVAERLYEQEVKTVPSQFYEFPVIDCGAEVEVGDDEAEVTCPSCGTALEVDPDADCREGDWVDLTRLIVKR